MIITAVREALPEECVVFDNPAFDSSIIGHSTDGATVYSYDKMVQEYIQDNQCSEEDAMEWIDFNTIRSLPYAASVGIPPIIVYELL